MKILGTFLACLVLSLGPAWPASLAVLSGRPPAGGSPAWYYAGSGKNDSSFTSNTTGGWDPSNFAYGAAITAGQSGTCTAIAVKASAAAGGGSQGLKIALYDASNNRLASGSTTVTGTTPAWYQVTINQAVSASTVYRVMVSGQTSDALYGYDTGSGNGLGVNVTYAAFPPSTISPNTETNILYGVKMFVE